MSISRAQAFSFSGSRAVSSARWPSTRSARPAWSASWAYSRRRRRPRLAQLHGRGLAAQRVHVGGGLAAPQPERLFIGVAGGARLTGRGRRPGVGG